MSFFVLFTTSLAVFTHLASAYTQATGDPQGNAIYEPGLNSIVPVGKPFSITWEPDIGEKVSLVLLHGPSSNVVPIATIAESIDNSGSYVWTPSSDLAPNKTYYGIELIVEGTGQYQYSTQFGISNPGYKGALSSNASAPTASAALSSFATATSTRTSRIAPPVFSLSAAASVSTTTWTASKASSASGFVSHAGSPSASVSTAVQTGAAVRIGASFGALAIAVGVAALIC